MSRNPVWQVQRSSLERVVRLTLNSYRLGDSGDHRLGFLNSKANSGSLAPSLRSTVRVALASSVCPRRRATETCPWHDSALDTWTRGSPVHVLKSEPNV